MQQSGLRTIWTETGLRAVSMRARASKAASSALRVFQLRCAKERGGRKAALGSGGQPEGPTMLDHVTGENRKVRREDRQGDEFTPFDGEHWGLAVPMCGGEISSEETPSEASALLLHVAGKPTRPTRLLPTIWTPENEIAGIVPGADTRMSRKAGKSPYPDFRRGSGEGDASRRPPIAGMRQSA